MPHDPARKEHTPLSIVHSPSFTTMAPVLTAEQLQQWEDDGYVQNIMTRVTRR